MMTEECVDRTEFDEHVELLYSSTCWPCKSRPNISRKGILQDYYDQCQLGADYIYSKYADNITTLRYGERQCEVIDIVSPAPVSTDEAERTTPKGDDSSGTLSADSGPGGSLLVYLHGGTWQEGYYKRESIHMARPVIESGYYHAAIGYLDLPDTDQPTLQYITEAITTAVNAISDWAGCHGIRRIILSGHSAGAHLVAMTVLSDRLNHNSRRLIRGMALLSGVYDLTPLLKTTFFIPELKASDYITAINLSPYQLMSEDNKPVVPHSLSHNIVVYGEDESEAYRSQATQFSRLLTEKGIENELIAGSGRDHCNLITELSSPTDPLSMELVHQLGSDM